MAEQKTLIQIKHGAEYPIMCDGNNHFYFEDLNRHKTQDKPFEKCNGNHEEI